MASLPMCEVRCALFRVEVSLRGPRVVCTMEVPEDTSLADMMCNIPISLGVSDSHEWLW